METQGGMDPHALKCPITQAQYVKPVRNTKCNHTYSEAGTSPTHPPTYHFLLSSFSERGRVSHPPTHPPTLPFSLLSLTHPPTHPPTQASCKCSRTTKQRYVLPTHPPTHPPTHLPTPIIQHLNQTPSSSSTHPSNPYHPVPHPPTHPPTHPGPLPRTRLQPGGDEEHAREGQVNLPTHPPTHPR